MAVQYNKLLKLLIDRNMTTAQLTQAAGVSANIIAKVKKGKYISLETAERICVALSCDVDDILEFVPENKIKMGADGMYE